MAPDLGAVSLVELGGLGASRAMSSVGLRPSGPDLGDRSSRTSLSPGGLPLAALPASPGARVKMSSSPEPPLSGPKSMGEVGPEGHLLGRVAQGRPDRSEGQAGVAGGPQAAGQFVDVGGPVAEGGRRRGTGGGWSTRFWSSA